MASASSPNNSKPSWILPLLAVLWTALITVLVIDTAASPDEFGLNGWVIGGLLLVWALGIAVGLGIRAVVRWLCSYPARER